MSKQEIINALSAMIEFDAVFEAARESHANNFTAEDLCEALEREEA